MTKPRISFTHNDTKLVIKEATKLNGYYTAHSSNKGTCFKCDFKAINKRGQGCCAFTDITDLDPRCGDGSGRGRNTYWLEQDKEPIYGMSLYPNIMERS